MEKQQEKRISGRVAVLGATGSIGTQALDVCARLNLRPCALAAGKNAALLERQARQFHPDLVALWDEDAARDLRLRLRDTDIPVLAGREGILACARAEADTVLTAMVGNVGLEPTLEAISLGRRIALANKETLVCAGDLVLARAKEAGAEILPVDSEHSAIWQCLEASKDRSEAERIYLTASGGPFWGMDRAALKNVTREDALRHPNWSMGAKITVDSATLINKGLELIEAMRLYHMTADQITVVVHRESVIHSMVEFRDHSIIAQLGAPDMRLPIQYALTYPKRLAGAGQKLDLFSLSALHFAPPDLETFSGLRVAMEAAKTGGTACVALNGANEAAVALFLQGKIPFLRIAQLVEEAVENAAPGDAMTLDGIWQADQAARQFVYSRQ